MKFLYITLFFLVSICEIYAQKKYPAENIASYESLFNYKVIKLSQSFKETLNIKHDYLQIFHYNLKKDRNILGDSLPVQVIVSFPHDNNNYWILKDDGNNCDKSENDRIYTSYTTGDTSSLGLDYWNIDVLFNVIGINYVIWNCRIKEIPDIPKIKMIKNYSDSSFIVVQWTIDKIADECGLFLLNNKPDFKNLFNNIIYEKNYAEREEIFNEKIPYDPLKKDTYLIIWSARNTRFNMPGEGCSYSMDIIKLADYNFIDRDEGILYQNYPNPFNSQTAILWKQKSENIVKITIYNLLGEKVIELVNSEMQGGNHSITWNGTNSKREKVPSGIYLLNMKINNFQRNIKIIKVK